nr:DUF4062 domain-containing protein [Propionicimonas sp.]
MKIVARDALAPARNGAEPGCVKAGDYDLKGSEVPSAKVRNLRVFLASPGGLDAERQAVEAVVSVLNAEIALTNRVVITVRRWEQMIGAAGNPQSQINPGVDGCDIFVGIVHRRWGTATGNGFDSGFGEEFARALDRWERKGEPRIALFFKQVDNESLRDPGDQLKKVLEFRSSIEEKHTAFYNLFESTDELKIQVFQLLVEAVVRLPAEPQAEVAGTATGDPAETAASDEERGPGELSSVLAAFADVTAGREPTTKLDVDRLELFGLAASRDDDPIPTHLANRIFTRREEISFHWVEVAAWFRTYLMDLGRASRAWERVIPFASVAGGAEQLGELLEDSAVKVLTSKDSHLVAGWLRLAAALKVRPKSIWLTPPLDEAQQSTLREVWASASTASIPLAVAYWLSVRRRQDLQLAKTLAEDGHDGLRSLGESLVGLMRQKPDATPLARSMPDLLIDSSVSDVFGDSSPFASLPAVDLEKLVLRSFLDKTVRLRALDELISRDVVPSSVIKAVLKDEGSTSFIGRSWSAEALERLFDRAVSTSFMNRFMDIIGEPSEKLDGSARAALARMARHNAAIGEIVMSLLQNQVYLDADNASMLLSRYEGTTEALDVAESLLRGTNAEASKFLDALRGAGADAHIIDFVQRKFEIVALKYLSRLPDARRRKRHLGRVRELATGDGIYQFQATECLIEMLEDEDVDLLIGGLTYMNEATSSRATAAIRRRATLKRLNELVGSQNEQVAVSALIELRKRGRAPSRRRLMVLMRSDMPMVRMAAASILIAELDRPDLSETLRKYVFGGAFYYYNVVCEFDREMAQVPQASPGMGEVTS